MSKLSPSLIRSTPNGLAWVRRAGAVKAMDDPSPFTVASDNALRVFRVYFPSQPPDMPPESLSNAILAALKGYRHPKLYVELFVGIPGDLLAGYIPLWTAATKLLHAAGVKVCLPSSYTGDYEPEHLAQLRAAKWAGADAVSLQAYWASAGFTRWNALRWQQPGYLLPGDPPLFIVECGRDVVRDGPAGTYIGEPGYVAQGVSTADFAQELLAFGAICDADPRVLAVFPFVLGPTPDWAKFDLEPVAPLISGGDLPTMALPEQYPNEYKAWVAAGGLDNNFLPFLIGIGSIQPKPEHIPILIGNVTSAAKTLEAAYPKAKAG